MLKIDVIPDYVTSSDENEEGEEVETSLQKLRRSLDGDKLHRPSDINSDASLSLNVKESFNKEVLNKMHRK